MTPDMKLDALEAQLKRVSAQLEELAKQCDGAAEYYGQRPGLAGSAAIIDLYQAMARLARLVRAK